MNEIWKSIIGYEGLYEVSDWGRVRSLGVWANVKSGSKRWRKGRVLKPQKYTNGYLFIALSKNNVVKGYSIHRLVAQAFLPNPDNLPCVNHKDKNKLNNRVENLEWCTYEYNNNYQDHNEHISKKLYQYTQDDKLCGMWPSVMECERRTGWSRGSISSCCNGQRNKHKGYKWSYNPPIPPKALAYYVI